MSEWVAIPPWNDVPDMPFVIGARAIHVEIAWPHRPEGRNPNGGRVGTIVAWGRSVNSDTHWKEQHPEGELCTCPYGRSCDMLVDSEGPVIRWDDQDPGDESLDWFPGQAMGAIEAYRGPIPRPQSIAEVERVSREMNEEGQ